MVGLKIKPIAGKATEMEMDLTSSKVAKSSVQGSWAIITNHLFTPDRRTSMMINVSKKSMH